MIEVSNLSFKYPGQHEPVFTDFSLRLEQNKVYGLLGKNGTGKSTLLYLISGLLRLTIGKDALSFYDEAIASWKAEAGQFEALIGTASDQISSRVKFSLK